MKMRKILSILITAGVVLTACKKDHHIKLDTSGAQKITFAVGFSQTTGSVDNSLKLAAADTSVTNNIDVLYFMLFDSNGLSIHNITQKKTDAAFGSYTENLHDGRYTIAVAGTKTSLTLTAGDASHQLLQPIEGNDLFFKSVSFNVSGSATTQAINLERVDSKVELLIKDKIPSNIASIRITAHDLFREFYVGSQTVVIDYLKAFNIPIPVAALGTSNYTVLTPPFLANGSILAVVIDALDSNGAVISERNLSNVVTGKNAITVLSGNLFGGNGGTAGGFTISLPTWNTPITQGF
jgi:hypothetical protein